MENIDKIASIVEYLDLNETIQSLIEEIAQESFDDKDYPLDENGNFIYNDLFINILKNNETIKELSDAEFQLLLDMIIKCILHKINAKENAHVKATEGAYEDENKGYYGDSANAYWHLSERYLGDYNYNKSISDFYSEYQEEKHSTK